MNTNLAKQKSLSGLIYGATGGLAFAIFAWGVDAGLLAQAHATYFWAKFIPGLLICLLAGGLAGWLTIRFNRHLAALILWSLLALLFAWLVIWLPLEAAPNIQTTLNPSLAQWLRYSEVDQLFQFQITAIIVIGFAAIISGLLEINLVENTSTPVVIMLVGLIAFGLAGSACDQLVNLHLREPIEVIDNLIQFAADHQGQKVPIETAREIHLSALNAVTDLDDLLQKSRQLTLITFDPSMGMMDILVDFEGALVICTAIHAQPTNCTRLSGSP